MKVAAAEALAKLAREDVPDEVDRRLFRPPAALRAGHVIRCRSIRA